MEAIMEKANRRQWAMLAVLALAQFMVVLDITVVNVAFPEIGLDLALDRAAATWVVSAYTLAFGGLLLLGGRLADVVGRRGCSSTAWCRPGTTVGHPLPR